MSDNLKPGIKEWAKIRARRASQLSPVSFRFWYLTNGLSVIATEVMSEAEAVQWLSTNNMNITAMLISETMTSKEAYAIIKRHESAEDEDNREWG